MEVVDSTATLCSYRIHCHDLSQCVQNPTSLAIKLFSTGILPLDTRLKILGARLDMFRRDSLMYAVDKAIELEPRKFFKFLEQVKQHDPTTLDVCDKMMSTFSECVSCLDLLLTSVLCSDLAQLNLQTLQQGSSQPPNISAGE